MIKIRNSFTKFLCLLLLLACGVQTDLHAKNHWWRLKYAALFAAVLVTGVGITGAYYAWYLQNLIKSIGKKSDENSKQQPPQLPYTQNKITIAQPVAPKRDDDETTNNSRVYVSSPEYIPSNDFVSSPNPETVQNEKNSKNIVPQETDLNQPKTPRSTVSLAEKIKKLNLKNSPLDVQTLPSEIKPNQHGYIEISNKIDDFRTETCSLRPGTWMKNEAENQLLYYKKDGSAILEFDIIKRMNNKECYTIRWKYHSGDGVLKQDFEENIDMDQFNQNGIQKSLNTLAQPKPESVFVGNKVPLDPPITIHNPPITRN